MATWFHGVISRQVSEELLIPRGPFAFLVRLSESRYGYVLSVRAPAHVSVKNRAYDAKGKVIDVKGKRVWHFMIEQNAAGQYGLRGWRAPVGYSDAMVGERRTSALRRCRSRSARVRPRG